MSQIAQLTDRIQERLVLEHLLGRVDTTSVKVRVRDRVAYLDGAVPNLGHKLLSTDITRDVSGVNEVVNMLRVVPVAVADDATLQELVHQGLAKNPQVDEDRVSVLVVSGIVHLSGSVSTVREACVTEDEVWLTPGIRGVANHVGIVSQTPVDSVTVVDDILQSLSQCLDIDTSRVDVAFADGVVHIAGQVQDERQRLRAEDLVWWTPSVDQVVNTLRVPEPGA